MNVREEDEDFLSAGGDQPRDKGRKLRDKRDAGGEMEGLESEKVTAVWRFQET